MKQMRIAYLVLSLAACAPPARVAARIPVAGCRSADDNSAYLLSFVKRLLARPTASDSALRISLGLNGIPASQVTLVTTTTLCVRAAAALDNLSSAPHPARRVYLIKAGTTHYFAEDPTATAGEYIPLWVMDRRFAVLKAILAH
jgi:hypothetical protein